MTLEEIDNSLPEGLHDAQIRSYVRDFESATLTLFVKVAVGLSKENNRLLEYRDGEIGFRDVQYFVSENPDAESTFRDSGCVWFSFGRADAGVIPEAVNAVLPPELLRYSIFIREWYSSMNIVARDVSFTWSK